MSRPNRIYISGPMTGVPEFNRPAFIQAEKKLARAGWQPVNPARNFGGRTDLPRESYLRADIALLVRCDAIALLPGWENSLGAQLEYLIARELLLPIYDATTGKPYPNPPSANAMVYTAGRVIDALGESILDEARSLTEGVRQNDYGHPREDFQRTALMWTGILSSKLREGASVTAMDVPLCMIALKLARQAHQHKRDNLVDVAGYARTAAMVMGAE